MRARFTLLSSLWGLSRLLNSKVIRTDFEGDDQRTKVLVDNSLYLEAS